MTNTSKSFLAFSVVAGICGVLAFIGFTPFIKEVIPSFGSSTQGSTGQTARQYNVYGVNLSAPGANATSSSVFNGTGNDLYITGEKVACENVGTSKTQLSGTGLTALTISAATSSAGTPVTNANTNLVTGSAITIATTTPNFISTFATASNGTSTVSDIWVAGSYLSFESNATNTAVCTIGVDVTSS